MKILDYSEDLGFDKDEFECKLRENIFKTEEFKKLFVALDLYSNPNSKDAEVALNYFKMRYSILYKRIKLELQIEHALSLLEWRCNIESYKRVNFPHGDDYGDTEDVISVCSDEDLSTLIDLIKKIRLR
ncbi:MAG: hypothetical protein ACFFG0_06180 [Candidatus Thorarchaeota archaeon]